MSKEIVQLNEQAIRTELKELVRQSVEEVLNGLLTLKQIDTNARKYERMKAGKTLGQTLSTQAVGLVLEKWIWKYRNPHLEI